jgi:hypothetical protein
MQEQNVETIAPASEARLENREAFTSATVVEDFDVVVVVRAGAGLVLIALLLDGVVLRVVGDVEVLRGVVVVCVVVVKLGLVVVTIRRIFLA